MCPLDCQVETINIYTDLCDSVPQQHNILSSIHKYAKELCGDKEYKIITLPPLSKTTPNEVQGPDAFFIKIWEDEKADIASIVANKIHYMHHAELFITSSLDRRTSGAVAYAIYQRQMPVLLLNLNVSSTLAGTAECISSTETGVINENMEIVFHKTESKCKHSINDKETTTKETEFTSEETDYSKQEIDARRTLAGHDKDNNKRNNNEGLNDEMIDAVAALLIHERKNNETTEECIAHFFTLYSNANKYNNNIQHNNNNNYNKSTASMTTTPTNSQHESNTCLQDSGIVSHKSHFLRWVYVEPDTVSADCYDVQTTKVYVENVKRAEKADSKEYENQHLNLETNENFAQAINANSEMSLQDSIFGRYRCAFENDARCVRNQTTSNVALLGPDGYPLYWGVHTPHASSLLPPPLGKFELIQHKLQRKQEEEQQQEQEVHHKGVANSDITRNKSTNHASKDGNVDVIRDNAINTSDKMSTQKNKTTIIDTSLLLDVLDIFSRYEHRGVLRVLLQRGYCVYLTTLHTAPHTEIMYKSEEEESSSSVLQKAITTTSANAKKDINLGKKVDETMFKKKDNLRVFEEHWLEMPIPQNDKCER